MKAETLAMKIRVSITTVYYEMRIIISTMHVKIVSVLQYMNDG